MTKSHRIVFALIAGLFVWIFADALFGGGVFVFRDAGHYYYPLFQFVAGEWKAGRVPLWNPYENLGVPLAGNATSSVFYPGTLVFLLPLDYAWAYKLHVMGHVLLAAWAAFRLGRHWGGSVEAAGVGAISYAFCGNVLFQYCNVIFLVGAAWLPLAMLAGHRMLCERQDARDERRVRRAVGFGVVLALMTLGGNAELAYHAGLMAAMYALWLWCHGPTFRPFWERVSLRTIRRSPVAPMPEHAQPDSPRSEAAGLSSSARLIRLASCRPALLAIAAATGWTLAAVQVIPSLEYTRLSGRAASAAPRTIYEIPNHLRRDAISPNHRARWADGLTCRRLEPGTHHQHVYHFSVGPWRLAEYLWPNVSGRQFPVHRRWLEVIPGEGRIWVPSFYMGLLPFVMALAAMRLRRGSVRESWLSWLVVLSVLASFGWYGLGWLVHQIGVAAGTDGPRLVGAPFGGLYWLMTVLLPGYVYFRYPAKLLVIAALGLSMLAVRGWDRAFGEPSPRLRRSLLWLGGVSLLGAAAASALLPSWRQWLANVEPNVLFGPLDTTGVGRDLVMALVQTAALCGAGWWLLGRAAAGRRWAGTVALMLVAVDVAAANGWMLACAPADQWKQEPKLAALIRREQARRGDEQPYRVLRHPIWMPPSWSSSGSPARLAEAMQWDRDTLWPKYNLSERVALAEVQGTIKPYDYQVLLWLAKSKAQKERSGSLSYDPPEVPGGREVTGRQTVPLFLPANVKYVVLREKQWVSHMEPIALDGTRAAGLEDVSLWHNPDHLPRVWIAHRVNILPRLSSNDPREVWRRTEQVFFGEGRPRDLRESTVVEGAAKLDGKRGTPGHEVCRVVRYGPSRVEIEAELKRPGLVVLCDQFYPGWRLDVETAGEGSRRVPILRTNRVMRGAWLAPGRHRLVYRYRPAGLLWGAAITGIGWIGLAAIALATAVLRRSKARDVDRR